MRIVGAGIFVLFFLFLACGCAKELPRERAKKLILPGEFKAIDAPNDDGNAVLLVWSVAPSDNVRPQVMEDVIKEKTKPLLDKTDEALKGIKRVLKEEAKSKGTTLSSEIWKRVEEGVHDAVAARVRGEVESFYSSAPRVKYILSMARPEKALRDEWDQPLPEVDSDKSFASENPKYFGLKSANEMLHYLEVVEPYKKLKEEESKLTKSIVKNNTEIEKTLAALKKDMNRVRADMERKKSKREEITAQLKEIGSIAAAIREVSAPVEEAIAEKRKRLEEEINSLTAALEVTSREMETMLKALISGVDQLTARPAEKAESFTVAIRELAARLDAAEKKRKELDQKTESLSSEKNKLMVQTEREIERDKKELEKKIESLTAMRKGLAGKPEVLEAEMKELGKKIISLTTEIEEDEKTIAVLEKPTETLKKMEDMKKEVQKARSERDQIRKRLKDPKEMTYYFKLEVTDGKETLAYPTPVTALPVANYFNWAKLNNFVLTVLFSIVVMGLIAYAKRNPNLFIRKISGLDAVDEAVGRATEMGKHILYFTGLLGMGSLSTIASTNILGRVARKVAQHDSQIKVPCNDPIVMSVCQEVVKEAYTSVGRPDAYRDDNIFFVSNEQFSFTAAADGMMMRDRPATNFFLGYFYAEALLLTEVGASVGAIQIAGTDALNQLPFFVTTCDYTLIGEELYAASAYLSREPVLLGSLKGQDAGKLFLAVLVIVGAILSSVGINYLTRLLEPL